MTVPIYFVSYSRVDLDLTRSLCETILAHGIDCWQDLSNLGQGISEETIRKAIAKETTGFLLLVTASSVKSTFIRTVEMRAADDRIRLNNGYHIIPVFGIPISDAENALSGVMSVPISNFNGAKLESPDPMQDIVQAGGRVATMILAALNLSESASVSIGLSSKQKAAGELALNLNFIGRFARELPPASVWDLEFNPALKNVKSALVDKAIRTIRLTAFCHLSMGCLFGYTFRRTTGFDLQVEQSISGVTHLWHLNCDQVLNPLDSRELVGDILSRDLFVVVNLVSSDFEPVKKFAADQKLSHRACLTFFPRNYPCPISGEEAAAIGRDVAQKIKDSHGRYFTNRVHLFLAGPIGLAVNIGYNLNACGSVQCYEFDNASRQYIPSCTLV